jgi:hypothetical protein
MCAFQMLNSAADVLHMGRALAVSGGSKYSNGGHFLLKRPQAAQYVKEVGGPGSAYSELPVKAMTISGVIFNDYVKASATLGGRLSNFPLSVPHYFAAVRHDIEFCRSLGVDMSPEERAWAEALLTQSAHVRQEVARELSKGGIERLMSRLRLSQILNAMRTFPARIVFEDVSDYVSWESKRNR